MSQPEDTFPDERDWLLLPLPPELEPVGGDTAFVERTLHALRADRELDAAIDAEDRALPRILLTAHTTPEPNPDFVASTLAARHRERRQRWDQLLARHVAPSPSPDFVARTLQALAVADLVAPAPTRQHPAPASRRPQAAWLLAAAAALVAWLAIGRPGEVAPFELRLAGASPAAWAHTDAGVPLAVLFTAHERTREPDALAMAEPDGLWLAFGGAR